MSALNWKNILDDSPVNFTVTQLARQTLNVNTKRKHFMNKIEQHLFFPVSVWQSDAWLESRKFAFQ